MVKLFQHHDSLRLFVEIARHASFSEAAIALNMTKGAISYQVKVLEEDFGLALFKRVPRGVVLTTAGKDLLEACGSQYEHIEDKLRSLKSNTSQMLTVGVSTYFASRWLSPRLMTFLQDHPDIQLRLQPMIRLFDLEDQGVDLAIRWGSGQWDDANISPIMPLPAFPVGNAEAKQLVEDCGLKDAIQSFTLLRDHDDSDAWTDWLTAAELPQHTRRDALIVPDPNVRVQSVIDGQGVALMDDLISDELEAARLFRLSDFELSHYGYFIAQPKNSSRSDAVQMFVGWITGEKHLGA